MLSVGEFVDDVMRQLNPFLKAGSFVEFELNVGCRPVKDKGVLPLVGCGNTRVSFIVICGEAIEHKPEN